MGLLLDFLSWAWAWDVGVILSCAPRVEGKIDSDARIGMQAVQPLHSSICKTIGPLLANFPVKALACPEITDCTRHIFFRVPLPALRRNNHVLWKNPDLLIEAQKNSPEMCVPD